MKRRNLMAMAAAGLAASVQAAEPRKTAAKTYVLVHGAYHGGWCWTHVAALLQATACCNTRQKTPC